MIFNAAPIHYIECHGEEGLSIAMQVQAQIQVTTATAEIDERYRLSSLLDHGQEKQVYRGWDRREQQEVAICRYPSKVRDSQACWQELQELLALPRHRNVMQIHEILLFEEEIYMVCELFIKGDLSGIITRGIEWLAVLSLASDLASGLDHIHGNGFLHRDVKPSNAFISERGAVIGDFDMACRAAVQVELECCRGTPAYMAPEKIKGEEDTESSDIYALGCTVYELATGARVFSGNGTVSGSLRNHLHAEPARPSADAAVPAWFDQLVLAMLDKAPSNRPSAKAVAAELNDHA